MSIVHPESLEEAVKIVRAWRDRPGETRLPEDYEGWHFEAGRPIDRKINFVKLAILTGYPIPEGFKHWDQVVKKTNDHWQSLAHWAAEQKYPFPADFEGWGLLDFRGTPVIHTFMQQTERVPDGFTQWEILDRDGLTVAHVYPMLVFKPLPPTFDDWHLRDKEGKTVAHRVVSAAYFTNLPGILSFPDDPDIWRLRDGKKAQGDTVMHLAASCGMRIPDSLPLEMWHSTNPSRETPLSLAVKNGHAHLVAQYEALKLAAGIEVSKTAKSSFRRESM